MKGAPIVEATATNAKTNVRPASNRRPTNVKPMNPITPVKVVVPDSLVDAKNGASYKPCGELIEGGYCARYTGHSDKHGGHRLTLERPVDPIRAAKAAAWKAMTEEEKQAEYARRAQVSAERKATAKAARSQAGRRTRSRASRATKVAG